MWPQFDLDKLDCRDYNVYCSSCNSVNEGIASKLLKLTPGNIVRFFDNKYGIEPIRARGGKVIRDGKAAYTGKVLRLTCPIRYTGVPTRVEIAIMQNADGTIGHNWRGMCGFGIEPMYELKVLESTVEFRLCVNCCFAWHGSEKHGPETCKTCSMPGALVPQILPAAQPAPEQKPLPAQAPQGAASSASSGTEKGGVAGLRAQEAWSPGAGICKKQGRKRNGRKCARPLPDTDPRTESLVDSSW